MTIQTRNNYVEEYNVAGFFKYAQERKKNQSHSMSPKRLARSTGVSPSLPENENDVMAAHIPRTVSPKSIPAYASMVPEDVQEYGHSHHNHHLRHVHHNHIHNGKRTNSLPVELTSPELAIDSIITENGTRTENGVEGAGAAQLDGSRIRPRIIRRGGRNSSSESLCSTKSAQEDVAMQNRCAELVEMYKQNGDHRELARIAREHGIPAQMRRTVWPILLANHPYVKEKSLAKEYRHQEESYTPRDIPMKRIRAELGRYHRRKNYTPSSRNSSPHSSTSPALATNGPASTPTVPTDPALLDRIALDTAVEDAVISFLQKHDSVTYARGMVYVCFALAEWIYTAPSILSNQETTEGNVVEDSITQATLLSTCFEQMMWIMLWAPSVMPVPTGRMEGITEQRISTFLSECRQLIPELCVIMDDEEALGFEEEWVHSWVQWWCAKEISKDQRGRLWDWHLGYQKPARVPGSNKAVPDEGFEEAFGPFDWQILVCVALLKCLHDHVDDLEQSEIRSLLLNVPDRQLGSMKLVLEEAKSFRKQLKELREQENKEYEASNAEDKKSEVKNGTVDKKAKTSSPTITA